MTPPPDGLPELPLPIWIAVDTPGADFDISFVRNNAEIDSWEDGELYERTDLYTADQMCAFYQKGREDERAQPCAAPGWRAIESAPRDGTRITVFRPVQIGNIPPVGDDYFDYTWMLSNARGQPTLWQPLPPPPESKP